MPKAYPTSSVKVNWGSTRENTDLLNEQVCSSMNKTTANRKCCKYYTVPGLSQFNIINVAGSPQCHRVIILHFN